jgi:hypothetical protein
MDRDKLDSQFTTRNNSKVWGLEGDSQGLKGGASDWGLDSKSFLKKDRRIPKEANIGIA